MDVNEMSIEQLEAALESKKKAQAESDTPVPLENPDYTMVVNLAKMIIKEMSGDDYHEDNDNKHWAYEAVMESVYGPDVWDWIRKQSN